MKNIDIKKMKRCQESSLINHQKRKQNPIENEIKNILKCIKYKKQKI